MVPEVETKELDEKEKHDSCELKFPDWRRENEGSTDHYKRLNLNLLPLYIETRARKIE